MEARSLSPLFTRLALRRPASRIPGTGRRQNQIESSFLGFLLTLIIFSERNATTIGKEENLVPHTVPSQLIGTGQQTRPRLEQTETPGDSVVAGVASSLNSGHLKPK
jgi:hypothetical protein